jgi:kynurenine formamidase
MTQLSNWGRWGKDDDRGTLNLVTDEKRRQAATLVKTGTAVPLGRLIVTEKSVNTAEPRPINKGGGASNMFLVDLNNVGAYGVYERQEVAYHGGALSHFDALCHMSYNDKVYNGFAFKDVVTEDGGCSKVSVFAAAREGIVTRGILLDLPGTRVVKRDIEAWEKRTGTKISSGDALLLRARRPGVTSANSTRGGYDPSLIPFFKERDIALLGADIAQEGGTVPGVIAPVHVFAMVALGMNLLDNLALDDLAATAERLKRWEFMLIIEPLRVQNGSGSPINPVALF